MLLFTKIEIIWINLNQNIIEKNSMFTKETVVNWEEYFFCKKKVEKNIYICWRVNSSLSPKSKFLLISET